MTKRLNRTILILLLFLVSPIGLNRDSAPRAAGNDLPPYVFAPLADWQDPDFGGYFLDMDAMVAGGKYTRLQAAEWQNRLRDCLFEKTTDPGKHGFYLEKCYQKAKYQVITLGEVESGFEPVKFSSEQEFVVVFDLDETLLSHWYEAGQYGPGWYDLKSQPADSFQKSYKFTGPDYVKFTPHWDTYLKKIKALPGCRGIVFFTAKEDQATWGIIKEWKIDGQPIQEFVNGIFTRNYLVRNKKVLKPSKDLRIIDPSLKHVVIIDDNPTRLFQPANVRVFPKFNADAYLKAKKQSGDLNTIRYFENLLGMVYREIREAAQYAQAKNTSFQKAYYPYSQAGAEVRDAVLVRTWEDKPALRFLRENHHLFEPKFFYKKKEKVE